jgi:hypothetical protein
MFEKRKSRRPIYEPYPPRNGRVNLGGMLTGAVALSVVFGLVPGLYEKRHQRDPQVHAENAMDRIARCMGNIVDPTERNKALRMLGANTGGNDEQNVTKFQYVFGHRYPMPVTGKVDPATTWAICSELERQIPGK